MRQWKTSSNGRKQSTSVVFELESNPKKKDGTAGQPYWIAKFMLNSKKMAVVRMYRKSYKPGTGKRKGKDCCAGFFQVVTMDNKNTSDGISV